ncbi:MAG: transcription elongation factor GreA [Chloroflexi bacterium]|nr:transcription elongation factor GreA [Chloroflexota bacterium]
MRPLAQTALSEACASFLQDHSEKDPSFAQQELLRFARWCGRDLPVDSLTPLMVENYCATLEGVGDDKAQRLTTTKKFLAYLHHEGLTGANLASHAKLRRLPRRNAAANGRPARLNPVNQLTPEGYQHLQEELAALKAQRPLLAEEIRKAAATKDITENSPLDAARELQGQTEARIRELENLLKTATILDGTPQVYHSLMRITVGSQVQLKDTLTGQEFSYMLVDSRETDPAAGKISDASPLGRAILDHGVGDRVDVPTPRGTRQYVVAKIGA